MGEYTWRDGNKEHGQWNLTMKTEKKPKPPQSIHKVRAIVNHFYGVPDFRLCVIALVHPMGFQKVPIVD